MAIANVALTDTFDYWRTTTNQIITVLNGKLVYCNTTNANTVSIPTSISGSSNLYVNIITSTSLNDSATANVASAFTANTLQGLAISYAAAANSNAQFSVTAANNYASILAANNAIGANGWTNTVSTTIYAWANSTFTTQTNTSTVFNTVNAAFGKANTAFQNTTGTFAGNLSISGPCTALGGYSDALGPVREKLVFIVSGNTTANGPYVTYIANSATMMHINVLDDNNFTAPANVGTVIDIYQLGTGTTKIVPNDAAVTVYSANNWANIAGQYLTAKIIKVQSNTWVLTGDLKA